MDIFTYLDPSHPHFWYIFRDSCWSFYLISSTHTQNLAQHQRQKTFRLKTIELQTLIALCFFRYESIVNFQQQPTSWISFVSAHTHLLKICDKLTFLLDYHIQIYLLSISVWASDFTCILPQLRYEFPDPVKSASTSGCVLVELSTDHGCVSYTPHTHPCNRHIDIKTNLWASFWFQSRLCSQSHK